MTILQMRRGMEIFAKYVGEDSTLGGAEHDVIYATPKDELQAITADDCAELIALGWYEGDYGWEHNV